MSKLELDPDIRALYEVEDNFYNWGSLVYEPLRVGMELSNIDCCVFVIRTIEPALSGHPWALRSDRLKQGDRLKQVRYKMTSHGLFFINSLLYMWTVKNSPELTGTIDIICITFSLAILKCLVFF